MFFRVPMPTIKSRRHACVWFSSCVIHTIGVWNEFQNRDIQSTKLLPESMHIYQTITSIMSNNSISKHMITLLFPLAVPADAVSQAEIDHLTIPHTTFLFTRQIPLIKMTNKKVQRMPNLTCGSAEKKARPTLLRHVFGAFRHWPKPLAYALPGESSIG
jgi:hypothetical protein